MIPALSSGNEKDRSRSGLFFIFIYYPFIGKRSCRALWIRSKLRAGPA